MHDTLSNRGLTASQSVLRVDMEAYFEAVENLYDPKHNPGGAFPLNVAENRLSVNLILQKIQEITRTETIPEWVAGYTSGLGAPSFREVMAGFLSQFLMKCQINPEHLAFSAGATSVVEMTSLVLGDPGDVVAIPAPCYPVYKQDVGNIAGLERYDIQTHHDISEIGAKMPLQTQHLDRTKIEIEGMGKRMRMLVITNPDNPTGGMYSIDQLQSIARWCIEHQIHLIVNEIYGLTLINTQHPDIANDYGEALPFQSFANVMQQENSDYLHWWYSFSKDFCISGFRVGALYSMNEQLLAGYGNLNYGHLVSNYTQWIIEAMLSDKAFVQDFITTNQKLLTEAYVVVIQGLRSLGIPYYPSRGSLFVWLDLSKYLEAETQDAENQLWRMFYDETGILLTPGQGFGHSKRGLFRMVYPYFQKQDLEVVMERMQGFVTSRK